MGRWKREQYNRKKRVKVSWGQRIEWVMDRRVAYVEMEGYEDSQQGSEWPAGEGKEPVREGEQEWRWKRQVQSRSKVTQHHYVYICGRGMNGSQATNQPTNHEVERDVWEGV